MGRHQYLTIRKGLNLNSVETKTRLSRKTFEELWILCGESRLRKTRRTVRYRGTTIEIDQYHDHLDSLIIAHLDYRARRSTSGMELPSWLGLEVTGLPEYLDRNLATAGLPAEVASNQPGSDGDGVRPITHAGAVPFRIVEEKLQVLCITSRNGKRWIVPKGVWEVGHTLQHTALTEAWEEAGVRGTLRGGVLGIIDDDRDGNESRIQLYSMEVEEEAGSWPEESFRTREWMNLGKAIKTVSSETLADLLRKLPDDPESVRRAGS
jgi:CYTH domain-containing protein/8-oxo-dGTP pyrophosphatase MutT (NUDIX family)